MCINNYIHLIGPGWRQLPSWRNCSWLSPHLWQWIHVAWGHPSHHHHCIPADIWTIVWLQLWAFEPWVRSTFVGNIFNKVWGLELYGVAGVLINSDGFLEVAVSIWHGDEYVKVWRPASLETETSHSGDDITSTYCAYPFDTLVMEWSK